MHPDEITINGEWRNQNLGIFKMAIIDYLRCLEELKGEGNKMISDEIGDWSIILQAIRSSIKTLNLDDEEGKLKMLGRNYGKLYDILSKYYSAKKQLLDEKKRKILDEAAHEGATNELERVRILLGENFWNHVNRKKTLVESFYPKQEQSKKQESIAMKITIGNLYGQFAALNNGSMIQNNYNEAIAALKQITEALINSKLPDNEKQDALLDIESMQSQLKKEKPNRKLLELGLIGLQAVANVAQIYQVIHPHLQILQDFIAKMPLIG